MAEEKLRNSVRLVGYLKETTLDERTSQNGRKFITGFITVAIDEFNTNRVKFLVFEDKNKDKYDALSKFLPENVISVASYLKANPQATFAVAANMAAKVWVMSQFEEFASRSGEREKTAVTLKGFNIGYCDENKQFVPCATFEVDAYIDSIDNEIEDEKETGRLILNTIVPAFQDLVYRISFVAPVEGNVAKYIKEKYHSGDFARLGGDLIAMRVKVMEEAEERVDAFGDEPQQYTTRFIRERLLRSGNKVNAFLTNDQIKKGLAVRETEMDKNGQRKTSGASKAEEAAPAENPVQAQPATTITSNPNDFDF